MQLNHWLLAGAMITLTGCVAQNQYDDLQGQVVGDVPRYSDIAMHEQDNIRIGLAFGGGAARGIMHLGVIKALQENGIHADVVTGTSVGSIAAVLYANNDNYDALEKTILTFSDRTIKDFIISKQGLIQGKALADWINDQIGYQDLAQMPIDVGIATTNVTTQQVHLFTGGNPGEAVQISSSVPGVFVPVTYQGDMFIDGGMLSLVPVYGARELGADIVIGVDVMCGAPPAIQATAVGALASAFWLQTCNEPQYEVSTADILITPIPSNPSFDDFGNDESRKLAIQNGYDATIAMMPKIKALLCERDAAHCAHSTK